MLIACGALYAHTSGCLPFGSDGRFTYDDTGTGQARVHVFAGDFTSDTTVTGVWSVRRGECADSGTWSAKLLGDASMSCSQFGAVELCAWVEDPTPRSEYSLSVYGQLLDDGVAVNADSLPMHAAWGIEATTATCDGQTRGGIGVAECMIDIKQAELGQTIPIEVTIEYEGQTYTTSTSFTRRQESK
jgi:hypothetical protein